MKNFYLLLITFILTQNTKAQTLKIDETLSQKHKIEEVINQHKNFKKDTTALRKFLSPLLKTNDNDLTSIYYALMAKGYADAHDFTNAKSDEFYKKAIKLSKKNKGLNAWILTDYGFYLYSYSKINEALKIFMDADNLISKTSLEEIILPAECYKKIGFFIGTIGDDNVSINYLKKALNNTNDPKEKAILYDNIGFDYLKINNLKTAKKYFLNAEKFAFLANDKERIAKVLGNLALLAQKEKKYDLAEELINKDLKISTEIKCDKNTMYALILKSKILLDKNKLNEAKASLEQAKQFATSKTHYKSFEYEITEIYLQIAVKENNTKQELLLRRKLDEIENILKDKDSHANLKKTNILVQKERYINQLSLANAQFENEQDKNKAYIIIFVLFISLVTTIFLAKNRKLKNRKTIYKNTVLQLQLEKIKSEQKLNDTKNTLESYKTYLAEKNSQIEYLNNQIKKIKDSPSFQLEEKEKELQKLLESHLMTDENWRKFKSIFHLEHPDFYAKLQSNFPDLTESNLRLITLSKLGLTNTEISSLLGITVDAVKKSKQRLRKKLGDNYLALVE